MFPTNDLWVVLILDNEDRCGADCTKHAETLSKAVRSSGGVLRGGLLRAGGVVMASGGDEELRVHSLFNVTHVPSLLMWPPGTGPRSEATALAIPSGMAVHMLDAGAKAVFDGLTPFIPSVITAPLRTPGFASFFEEPPCCAGKLARAVLLHSSARPSPLLRRLAVEFANRAQFAIVPASDAAALAAWGVDNASLPALLVSPAGGAALPPPAEGGGGKKKKGAATAAGEPYVPAPGSLAGWRAFPKDRNMTLAALTAWLNATIPAAPVRQLRSQADFERAAGAPGVTFIAVLPPGAARAPLLRALSAVAGAPEWLAPDFDSLQGAGGFTAARLPFHMAWVDGAAQGEWAAAFDAPTPGMVAFNARKSVFATMKTTFTEANVRDFVEAVVVPKNHRAKEAHFQGVVRQRAEVAMARIDRVPPLAATAGEKGEL